MMRDEWLEADGLGHVSEIADAEAPRTPRGCPFQAWSLAELLRLDRVVLIAENRTRRCAPRPAALASSNTKRHENLIRQRRDCRERSFTKAG